MPQNILQVQKNTTAKTSLFHTVKSTVDTPLPAMEVHLNFCTKNAISEFIYV